MTFPGANASITRNEAGEPVGWDHPAEPEWHDCCGSYRCVCDDFEGDE